MRRTYLFAAALAAALLPIPRGAAAQAPAPVAIRAPAPPPKLNEVALTRARRAAELRDTLLRLRPDMNMAGIQGIDPMVVDFLKDPYHKPAVKLEQLDATMAAARRWSNENKDNVAGASGSGTGPGSAGAAAAAALATGGAGALPMLAVGATDFFIARAKDEVAFGFVVSLRDRVRNDAFIAAALPRSHALIEEVESQTYQSFIPFLRSAFVEDLDELPTRSDTLAKVLKLSPAQALRARTYLQGIAVAYARGLEIRRGAPPAVALSNLITLDSAHMSAPETRRALHIVGLLAREYAAGGGQPLIEDLTRRDNGWMRRYFVALVGHELVKMDSIPQVDGLMQFLSDRESDALLLLNQIHAAKDAVNELRGQQDAGASADRVLAAAGAVLNVLRTAPRFVYVPNQPQPAGLASFDSVVAEATRLHQALTQRDYGTLVTWLLQNPHFSLCAGVQERQCDTRNQYVSLAASLASAKSSEEVTRALETASSPVGSYRAKRSQDGRWFAPYSASLTGYLGAARYQTPRAGTTGGESVDAGVGLPVGPEVSLGMPWGAMSLFVPLIDLGPVANERLGLAGSDASGEFDRDQIFSPGVMLMLNLTRSLPITLGAGVEVVRRDNGSATDPRRVSVTRSVLMLGVDATLFHFRF